MLVNTFLHAPTQACHKQAQQPALIDWASLQPYFGFQSEDAIKATNQVTSHYAGMVPTNDYLKKHYKTRNPVFNIPHQNEPITTNTVMSDTMAMMMAAPWPNSLLDKTLSKLSCNLSTHCLTTFASRVPWQPLLLMVENMKFPRRLQIVSAPFLSLNTNLSPTISSRTNLRTDMRLSKATPTPGTSIDASHLAGYVNFA